MFMLWPVTCGSGVSFRSVSAFNHIKILRSQCTNFPNDGDHGVAKLGVGISSRGMWTRGHVVARMEWSL